MRVRNPNLHVWSRGRILLSTPVSDGVVVSRQGRADEEGEQFVWRICRHQVLTSHLLRRGDGVSEAGSV